MQNLDELRDDETIHEVAELLNEYYRRGSIETAIKLGELGVEAFRSREDRESTVPLLCMMASYAMLQSRSAPKSVLPSPRQYKAKSDPKQTYFQKATSLVTQAEEIDARNGFVLDTKGGFRHTGSQILLLLLMDANDFSQSIFTYRKIRRSFSNV